jgi:hypothetical protein
MINIKLNNIDKFFKALNNYFGLIQQIEKNNSDTEKIKDLENKIIEFLVEYRNFNLDLYRSRIEIPYNFETFMQFIKEIDKNFDINDLMLNPNPSNSSKREEDLKSIEFRAKLNELMKSKNVKSNDVIKAIGINQSVFSKIKVGIRKPTNNILKSLNEYFNYDFNQYFND